MVGLLFFLKWSYSNPRNQTVMQSCMKINIICMLDLYVYYFNNVSICDTKKRSNLT